MRVTFEFTGLATLAQKNASTSGGGTSRQMDALSVLFPQSRYGGVVHRPWLMTDVGFIETGQGFDHVIDIYTDSKGAAPGQEHKQYALWDINGYDLTIKSGSAPSPITGGLLTKLPTSGYPGKPDDASDWHPLNWIVDLEKANKAVKVPPKSDCVDRYPSNPDLAGRLTLESGGVLRGLPPLSAFRTRRWIFEDPPTTTIYGPQAFTDSFEVEMNLTEPVSIVCSLLSSSTLSKTIQFKPKATDVRFKIVNLDDRKAGSSSAVDHFLGHYDLTNGGSLLPTPIPGVDPVFCFVAMTEY